MIISSPFSKNTLNSLSENTHDVNYQIEKNIPLKNNEIPNSQNPNLNNKKDQNSIFHTQNKIKEFSNINNEYKNNYSKYNCSSYFISPVTNIFPKDINTIRKIPFLLGINFSPLNLNGNEIPLIDYYKGDNNYPRCKNQNCHAYICPFTKFINNGNEYICHICKFINKTENYFYQPFNENNKRIDFDKRIELCNGSYEFITSKSYWSKNPGKTFFIFVIDTSLFSIMSNFLFSVIESLKDSINNNSFFNYSFVKVSFITYNSDIQFYSFNKNSSQPQILCINDEEPFLPIIKDLLIFDLNNEKDKILKILDCISNNYLNNNENKLNYIIRDSNKIFDAIKSAYLIGENLGGNIFLFSSSNNINKHPKMNGNIEINNNNIKQEAIYYSPNDNKQLGIGIGLLLAKENLSIDIFINCEKNINLYTLNQLCEYTNGTIQLFKNYNYEDDYIRLYNQIRKSLLRINGNESEMRVRFSNGYKIQNFFTRTLIRNNNFKVFIFPSINSEQSYQVSIDLNEEENKNNKKNLNNNSFYDNDYDDYLFIQSALLYSSGDGNKKIRIHNLCIPLSNDINEIFNEINYESLICMNMKIGIDKIYKTISLSNSVIFLRNNFTHFIDTFLNYQKENDNLRNYIIYFLGMLKNIIFNINEIENKNDIDYSNYYRIRIQKIPNEDILSFIYPNIYQLNNLLIDQNLGLINEENGNLNLPNIIPPEFSSLENDGFYLIDNGFYLILYFRRLIDSQIIKNLFDCDIFDKINMNINENLFFEKIDSLKEKILNIIDYIRSYKTIYQKLIFIFEGNKNENIIKDCLIYDNFCNWYKYDFKSFYKKYILSKN